MSEPTYRPTFGQAAQILQLILDTHTDRDILQTVIAQSSIMQDVIYSAQFYDYLKICPAEGKCRETDPALIHRIRVGFANALLEPIIQEEKFDAKQFAEAVGITTDIPPIPFTMDQIVAHLRKANISPNCHFLHWIPAGLSVSRLQNGYPAAVCESSPGTPIHLQISEVTNMTEKNILAMRKKLSQKTTAGQWVLWSAHGIELPRPKGPEEEHCQNILASWRKSIKQAKVEIGSTLELLYLSTRFAYESGREIVNRYGALWTSDKREACDPQTASLCITLQFTHQTHKRCGLEVNDYYAAVNRKEHCYITPLVKAA